METQIDNRPFEQEVQVYQNEYFSGILMLAKKLFML